MLIYAVLIGLFVGLITAYAITIVYRYWNSKYIVNIRAVGFVLVTLVASAGINLLGILNPEIEIGMLITATMFASGIVGFILSSTLIFNTWSLAKEIKKHDIS